MDKQNKPCKTCRDYKEIPVLCTECVHTIKDCVIKHISCPTKPCPTCKPESPKSEVEEFDSQLANSAAEYERIYLENQNLEADLLDRQAMCKSLNAEMSKREKAYQGEIDRLEAELAEKTFEQTVKGEPT